MDDKELTEENKINEQSTVTDIDKMVVKINANPNPKRADEAGKRSPAARAEKRREVNPPIIEDTEEIYERKRGVGIFNNKLFQSMSLMIAIPVVLVVVILLIIARKSISDAVESELYQNLKSTSREAQELFEVLYPDGIRQEADGYYAGDVNLSDDMEFVDRIKANTGNDITILYGDVRVSTTLLDENGERLIGTRLNNDEVYSQILAGKENYISDMNINSQSYYGYYVPVFDGNQNVVGMIFSGVSNSAIKMAVNSMIAKIIIAAVIIVAVVLIIILIYARSLAESIGDIEKYVEEIEYGATEHKMPQKVLVRKDELGDMGRHAIKIGRNMRNLIFNDALTGIYNRRAGWIELGKYIDKIKVAPEDFNLTVAIGDLDLFKRVNDTYGHDYGDIVLRKAATIFKEHLKDKGFPVRWGGEEFLMIVRGDMTEAMEILNGILDELRGVVFEYPDGSFSITMTMGVTSYREGDTIDGFINRADQLLYQGKESGRNCIVQE
ncbi:MAG: diguanylate cyclase [Lachnospiraceae bacterium]|nr:diguanylate cyclase [Lachnospiraceae bacterium]